MNKGKIFIISGPSGSGKTTLYKKLLADPRYKERLVKTVSVTTRFPRPGEKHGRDYIFISKEQFLYRKRAGHFLESERVFDNYYGTPKKKVLGLLSQGKNVLLCIDVKGARMVRRHFPKAIAIFIKTPSLAILRKRLAGRGSEDKKAFELRLKIARKELLEAPNYQHVVVNDDLSSTIRRLKSIVDKELYKNSL